MNGSTTSSRRWCAVLLSAALLATIVPNATADTRGGNYLLITPPTYAGSAPLTQFINAKTAQGFNVTTYEVPSGTSNTTIRNYILDLWETPPKPDYVLLVGDANGYSSTNNTLPYFNGGGTKNAPTDLPYGCMGSGDDWHPEIPVGRFSVTSVSMLQDVVDKSLFVEAGDFPDPDYIRRGAFLAHSSTCGMAEPTHDWVIENYFEPNGYEGIRLYASQGAGTQDVTNAVNYGCLWVVYYGHAVGSWWQPAFTQSDVRALSNEGLYGVVTSHSCKVGDYFREGECFGETWLREANKGAAAVIFPSEYIYWGSQEAWLPSTVLEHSWFRAFFEDDIWEVGSAWQAALYHFEADFTGSTDIERNFFEEFNLLGDPALLLPKPNGFTVDAQPESHELCCPPTDQTQYTIEVGQVGEFSDPVTLSASGEPTGATISFTSNSLPPPFSSTMTVGNLSGVAAGSYDILITGTGGPLQRSTSVGLDIWSDVPPQVTLLSPEDGATGVIRAPELSWQGSADAVTYDVEIATDPEFINVVYSATTSYTTHQVQNALDTLAHYYWHVRANNPCGTSGFCPAFSFTTVDLAMPVAYDMLNGEGGIYTYYDDAYDGDGDNTQPLAPLSNGLGDLTDGIIARGHWSSAPGPYVGWITIDPTITFHFDEHVRIEAVLLYLDDAGGGGGVHVPDDVTISMGGTQLVFPVTDPPGDEPFTFVCDELGLEGETLDVTLADYSTSGYMMLSEVEIFGGPNTGACCIGETCSITTEEDCLASGGWYQGDGIGCDPNPCILEPRCLIISEVVMGACSGNCPKWIEITNTGVDDFWFSAGGVIVQTDDSADITVDVDLSGVLIPPGDSFVINSTAGCAGGFQIIYGFEPDLETDAPFGDGNDRYLLTDSADGTSLLDSYGEFGVDGTGRDWEYTDGYSYRRADYSLARSLNFRPEEWFFGGVDSLVGDDAEQLLRDNTSPGRHTYNEVCMPGEPCPGDVNEDGQRDLSDLGRVLATYGLCPGDPSYDPAANLSQNDPPDGCIDLSDLGVLLAGYGIPCP